MSFVSDSSNSSNKDIDLAVNKIDKINEFLKQQVDENIEFDTTIELLKQIADIE